MRGVRRTCSWTPPTSSNLPGHTVTVESSDGSGVLDNGTWVNGARPVDRAVGAAVEGVSVSGTHPGCLIPLNPWRTRSTGE
ncbi:hypothetical protein GCM10027521_20370 [Amycolatopsis cihanbeyliensis]